MAFKWDSFFETGIAVVDQQHRGLVDLINQAAPLLTSPSECSRARLDDLLAGLISYADLHFRTEERLMQSHGLLADYCDRHRSRHQDFVKQVVDLRERTGVISDRETGTALLRFLTSWLTFHILDEDHRMARQIRAVDAGVAPAEALQQALVVAPDDRPREALIAALVDLYAVVAESNRQLESKVAARTQELTEALAVMERAQGQLLQSEKMAAIGQLAAGVAHEINNPIGFVNSNLGSLRKYVGSLLAVLEAYAGVEQALPAGDPQRQRIEAAVAGADLDYLKDDIIDLLDESAQGLDRVRKIVQDLRDFSHVDEAEWQEADINAGLESTLNVVRNEIKYKAEVVRNFAALPPVRCIAAQINQVFMNLLVNAAQAISGQGTITLSTGREGEDRVWIEIADTGSGMSEEVQKRIFEPFFTTKPVGKGTGLGLSISWDIIVKNHGGSFAVDSAPGRGTKFRITLPIDGV